MPARGQGSPAASKHTLDVTPRDEFVNLEENVKEITPPKIHFGTWEYMRKNPFQNVRTTTFAEIRHFIWRV